MKRAFDVLCAAGLILVLLAVIGIVAILVKRKLGSPVIFKQERPGLHAKPFYLYKFRTMTDQKDSLGNLLPDEVRLTAFGQFLRNYSLDELPQLWNVLKGDISLVGPRPLLMSYLELYTKEQMKRHDVKPGITGWAQVNGRNAISWDEKFRLDVWYAQNHSILLDLKILLLTIRKVFKTEGIKHANHATMPVYKGSLTEYEKM
ncbi:sugar transferase [Fictibacillus halophilus]|uniref:sugar transferase n=1 Tax=Fictibacillus halophilus TaxID=1610490 RepID=UPI00363EF62B